MKFEYKNFNYSYLICICFFILNLEVRVFLAKGKKIQLKQILIHSGCLINYVFKNHDKALLDVIYSDPAKNLKMCLLLQKKLNLIVIFILIP